MANVDESGESEQTRLANVDEFSKSDPFTKRVLLASTQIRQKWQISGEYSNSINSLSSGHCLLGSHFNSGKRHGISSEIISDVGKSDMNIDN